MALQLGKKSASGSVVSVAVSNACGFAHAAAMA
jgi:hypothetical protein